MNVYSNMVELNYSLYTYSIQTTNIEQSYDIVNEITKYAAKAPSSRPDVLRLDLMC
jgi:hypothetical protein